MAARREITKKYAHQYRAASKKDKSVLLDSLTATTGWTRDHARRAIRAALTRKGAASQQKRRPRPRKYSYDAVKVLQHVWSVTGQPSGKYLAPVMDDTLNRLERFKEFGKVTRRATPAVLTELRSMSAATIDRYLKPFKDAAYPAAGLSATRPAPHILSAAVPLRTSLDGPITDPGLVEVDTVAHCGHTLVGEFLWTLSATLPVSGYTVLTTVKNKAFVHIGAGMDRIVDQMPVPVAEVHVDNGSEFINWGLIDWAKGHDIAMSRSRPYKKNDNAHVEQRNGDWVRRHAFRYRYETATELQLLNQLWPLVMARKNHLLALRQGHRLDHHLRGAQEAGLRQAQDPLPAAGRLRCPGPRHTGPPGSRARQAQPRRSGPADHRHPEPAHPPGRTSHPDRPTRRLTHLHPDISAEASAALIRTS